MIVVMPNGNAPQTVSQGYGFGPTPALTSVTAPPPPGQASAARGPAGAPGAPGGGAVGAAGRGPQPYEGSYPQSLVKEIVPFIERNYRVLANKNDRAIAGLSMGAGHTIAATCAVHMNGFLGRQSQVQTPPSR